jgi:RecA-family ATPase
LKTLIEAEGVGFLIVDNASDSFGANPIDRQAVTKFIRALVRLVQCNGGAVLLLSHVNKTTSRNSAKQADSEGYAEVRHGITPPVPDCF